MADKIFTGRTLKFFQLALCQLNEVREILLNMLHYYPFNLGRRR